MIFRYWHRDLASLTCMLIVLLAGHTTSRGEESGTPAFISQTPLLDRVIQSWPVDPAMTMAQECVLWEALCQPYTPSTIEIPLDRWVDTVASICPMEIDAVALEGIGLSADVVITFRLGHPPRPLLAHLLSAIEDLQCAVEVRHGTVRITTRDAAESQLAVRIYDISPLTGGQDGQEKLAALSVLMNTIQNVIDPDGWEVLGGMSVIQVIPLNNKQFFCVATATQTHWKLQVFLDQLQRAGGKSVSPTSRVPRRASSSLPNSTQSIPRIAPDLNGPPRIETGLPRFQGQ